MRPTVTGYVVEYITEKIISGEMSSGQQIRQEALAREMQVSRVPVREALLQLEADGLVTIHTHRGAVVAEMSVEDATDVFEARSVLEAHLLEKAVQLASFDDLEEIKRAMNAYDDAIEVGASPAVLSSLNREFHLALVAPSHRPRSLTVIRTLYRSIDRYLGVQIRPKLAQIAAVKDHHAIFDAYTSRDVPGLRKLCRQHSDDAFASITDSLQARMVG